MTATAQRPRSLATAPRSRFPNPTAAQDVRRTLLALLAAALGMLPLSELLTDIAWIFDVWVAMAVVIVPAALLRLRRPPSAGQIWVGLLLLVPWLTLRFLHVHAIGGVIPGPGAWHDVGRLMTDLHHTTNVESAPVHSTPAVRLALCLLLALVAALVDLIAVVGRRGALGGVPLLVVFTVSGAVPRTPVSWWLFAVAAGGFLILLALDSSDDLHRWGHYVARANPMRTRTAATGQRIAIAAIALAIVLPTFVPSDSRNLLANLFHNTGTTSIDGGFGRTGDGTGGIDPFVALKGQLDRKTPTDLFDVTVQSRSGDTVGFGSKVQLFYARANVLSNFTGKGWVPADAGHSESLSETSFESTPGTAFTPVGVKFAVHVSVTHLTSNAPSFSVPTAVSGLSSSTRWNPQDQLLTNSTIHPGDSYDLTVEQPTPSVGLLESAGDHDAALDRWLRLPPIAASVRSLVAQLTRTAATPYERARALDAYFADPRNGFQYSLTTGGGDSGNDLVDFLRHRTGYCQQYAAALAVMLRLANVPSRVVLGYTHSIPTDQGKFTVTTNDAHSWVEAYFAGVGWVPFDPTPLAGITGGAANDLPWAPHKTDTQNGSNIVPKISSKPNRAQPSAGSSAPVAASSGSSGGIAGALGSLITLAVVIALALLALIPWSVRERRRRSRVRRARGGDTDALWAELSDTAVDLGYVWSPARTPRQVARWLAGPSGAATGQLTELARAVERSRYAPSERAGEDGQRLVSDLSAVRAGLLAGRSRGDRVRAALLPASLGWRALSLLPGRRRRH